MGWFTRKPKKSALDKLREDARRRNEEAFPFIIPAGVAPGKPRPPRRTVGGYPAGQNNLNMSSRRPPIPWEESVNTHWILEEPDDGLEMALGLLEEVGSDTGVDDFEEMQRTSAVAGPKGVRYRSSSK